MKISSPVLKHNEKMPAKYTCDGIEISPPLFFSDVPLGTKSLALVVSDPDAPVGTWVHWLMWNIPPDTEQLVENSVPLGATLGVNTAKTNDYVGPCPPSGSHRYFFNLYALKIKLGLDGNANIDDFERATMGQILDEAELVVTYSKK